jgi:hypothetical protein
MGFVLSIVAWQRAFPYLIVLAHLPNERTASASSVTKRISNAGASETLFSDGERVDPRTTNGMKTLRPIKRRMVFSSASRIAALRQKPIFRGIYFYARSIK